MRQKLIKLAKLLLIVLFVSYYGGTTLFYHTHEFGWSKVTHSHPFFPVKDSPGHSHTPDQCQAIDYLSSIILLVFIVSFLVFNAQILSRVYNHICLYISQRHVLYASLRAPPIIIC